MGPDVYDFNGVNAYNVMVLHKDNTIEMYNLKGDKPSDWKGIKPSETVESLPELIKVGKKNYWIVRTSRQALIYPFYGGNPLSKFSGDQMFLPTTQIKVKNATTIEGESYDGKKRTVTLK